MLLKNKKNGEIGTLKPYCDDGKIWVWVDNVSKPEYRYNSLAELNSEWEDVAEEPKKYWFINASGEVYSFNEEYEDKEETEASKTIGNHFETKEEAEKAAEKLKAWHKLMGYWETEVLGWEIRDMPTGGNWQTVNVKLNIKARKEPMELVEILFGGEE